MNNFLPAAAIVTICIFGVKETLELLRRERERKRKLSALKELISHEVRGNYRAFSYLYSAICITDEKLTEGEEDTIVVQHAGRLYFERTHPSKFGSGNPVPSPCMTEFNRLLPTIAEIDKEFYATIREGYDTIFQLEDLHHSFVDYVSAGEKQNELFELFRQYAWGLHDDMEKCFNQLYATLTGRQLRENFTNRQLSSGADELPAETLPQKSQGSRSRKRLGNYS